MVILVLGVLLMAVCALFALGAALSFVFQLYEAIVVDVRKLRAWIRRS